MIHIVKEPLDVNIDNEVVSTDIRQKHCSGDCMVRTSIWPKSIAMLMEFCFAYWLQDLLDTLLNDPVFNSRNPQRTHTPIWFRYFYSPDGMWMETPKPVPNIGNQFFRMLFSHLNNCGFICAFCLASFILL